MPIEKLYISAHQLLYDSFSLGKKILEAKAVPKKMVAVWRGGGPVEACAANLFKMHGEYKLTRVVVTTASYEDIGKQSKEFVVKGLEPFVRALNMEDHVLFVDDIYDKGHTKIKLERIVRERARRNCPPDENIRFATAYWKKGVQGQEGVPDFYAQEVPLKWIVFPHELEGLSDEEISAKGHNIAHIIKGVDVHADAPAKTGVHYLTADEFLQHSFILGKMVAEARDEFFPDYIVTLWPGGVNAGLCVHEMFKYLKEREMADRVPDHIAINAHHSYSNSTSPIITGLEYLEERVEGNNILLVDTTFRSGRLANAVAHRLKSLLRRNISKDNIRIACVYFNPEDDATWNDFPVFRRPHHHVFESGARIIYPQSVHKLKADLGVVREKDSKLYDILKG